MPQRCRTKLLQSLRPIPLNSPPMENNFRTPIVLIAFNRPRQTAEVVRTIRAQRPARLFIIADGPRPGVETDPEKCAAVRGLVEKIDWPCQVERRFAETNLGLRRNVAEGLDWVFQQTERAIILEDDCLPHPTFFPFCEELLDRYAEDRQVAAIGGTNLEPSVKIPMNDASYYFSRFCHIWGWATWRRAWQLCDHELKEWPALRQTGWLMNICGHRTSENFWRRHFDDAHAAHPHGLNTWDVAWVFACWRHSMMSIVPRTNLITNIGCGAEASHIKTRTRMSELPTTAMRFPLVHPSTARTNQTADCYVQKNFFEGITLTQRLYWKLRLPLPIWAVRRVVRCFG